MNKNPFEKGDIAICIDNRKNPSGHFSYEDKLTLGKEYEVKSAENIFREHHVTVMSDEGKSITPYAKRFELKEKPMNTNNTNVPSGYYIAVKDQNLSEFFQKLFFAEGYKWRGGGTVMKYCGGNIFVSRTVTDRYGFKVILTSTIGGRDFPTLNGVNDFAKIMELIKTPIIEEVKAPFVNGYNGEYKKKDTFIKFGCAKISLGLVDSINTLLNSDFLMNGNRNVKSITLDSGVTLTKEQIVEIKDYITKIDKS